MNHLLTLVLFAAVLTGCNNDRKQTHPAQKTSFKNEVHASAAGWKGTISNGMKGDAIRFTVNGNKLQDLTFVGYWRCSGRLEQTTLGPEESFAIENGTVNGVVTEPKTGFRFEIQGTIEGDKAEGSIRFSNVGAGCDTYRLIWNAVKE